MSANESERIERRGGRRTGSGRKPKGPRAGVEHRPRAQFQTLTALHITVRVAPGVYNLRSRRSYHAIAHAMRGGADRFGVRSIQFCIQGNHMHILVETADATQLPRAMKGLGVRLARALNKMMKRRGQVIGDRYHSRTLATADAVRIVINYIADNHRRHVAKRGQTFKQDWVDPYWVTNVTVSWLPTARSELILAVWPHAPP